MSWVMVAMGVTAASGAMQAYGQYQQGATQKQYYDYLAANSEMQGEYAYRTGMKQSELIQDSAKYEGKIQKRDVAQFAAAQRATLVANGIDLSSVTSEDIASDTISKARMDELAIRFNADSKSWSTETDAKYRKWAGQQEAKGQRFSGAQAKYSGKTQAFTTLLSTAASMFMMGTSLGGSAAKTTTSGGATTFSGGGLKGTYSVGASSNAGGFGLQNVKISLLK